MLTLAGTTAEAEEQDKLTPFEEEAARRYPDTPRHKLVAAMRRRSRQRARNKMRRESLRANREST